MPGPRETFYFAGAPVVANHPISMAVDGAGLNITLTSYRDNLDFGIVVDRDQVPDAWNLVGDMRDGLAELIESIERRSAPLAS